MQGAQPEKTARGKLHKVASELDATITTMSAACSALLSFLDLGTEPLLTLQERIHYQTGALEMADELATYLPLIQSAIPKVKSQLLYVQERVTQEATQDEERQSEGKSISQGGSS